MISNRNEKFTLSAQTIDSVSAICVGSVKHLPVDALEKICDVLDCQPADLMEFVREPVEGVQ